MPRACPIDRLTAAAGRTTSSTTSAVGSFNLLLETTSQPLVVHVGPRSPVYACPCRALYRPIVGLAFTTTSPDSSAQLRQPARKNVILLNMLRQRTKTFLSGSCVDMVLREGSILPGAPFARLGPVGASTVAPWLQYWSTQLSLSLTKTQSHRAPCKTISGYVCDHSTGFEHPCPKNGKLVSSTRGATRTTQAQRWHCVLAALYRRILGSETPECYNLRA